MISRKSFSELYAREFADVIDRHHEKNTGKGWIMTLSRAWVSTILLVVGLTWAGCTVATSQGQREVKFPKTLLDKDLRRTVPGSCLVVRRNLGVIVPPTPILSGFSTVAVAADPKLSWGKSTEEEIRDQLKVDDIEPHHIIVPGTKLIFEAAMEWKDHDSNVFFGNTDKKIQYLRLREPDGTSIALVHGTSEEQGQGVGGVLLGAAPTSKSHGLTLRNIFGPCEDSAESLK